MKNKTKSKLAIDILMIIAFIFVIINWRFLPIRVHEVTGIITATAFVSMHLVLNWTWIKNTTKNLLKGRFEKKKMGQYILLVLLFVFFIATIATGISISTFFHPLRDEVIHQRHTLPSVIFVVLCIVHIVKKHRYLKTMLFKKKRSVKAADNSEK